MTPKYFEVREGSPAEGQEYFRAPSGDYIIIDLDEEGRILGIEVLLKDNGNEKEEADTTSSEEA